MVSKASWKSEVEGGERFEFGANWADFLTHLSPERIEAAEQSLKRLLGSDRLDGKTFLDIGSGSGLFSLAARRLGARVTSFDYDPQSVACTSELKRRFFDGDPDWAIVEGSVLDEAFLESLGTFDIVYSWGVLHHSGELWKALKAAAGKVSPGGTFAFALYEKTPLCGAWRVEKRLYARAGPFGQRLIRWPYTVAYQAARFASGRGIKSSNLERGMKIGHDIHDWLGGFPYESTNREEVAEHLRPLGLEPVLEQRVTVHLAGLFGTGCSEYVYRRVATSP